MFIEYIFLVILYVITITNGQSEEPHCIWYGECNIDDRGRVQNCPYDGPGKILDDQTSQDLMLKLCPDIYKNSKF